MRPNVRKFALTAHVIASVGWAGAVAAFLALAVAGLSSQNGLLVRGVYLAMELTGWYVIAPLSFAALGTGVIQSLGTSWGLFRHYWVVATLILLVHMQPIGEVAAFASQNYLTSEDLRGVRVQLVVDAIAAIVVLLVATGLSIYKPEGKTPYARKKSEAANVPTSGLSEPVEVGWMAGAPRWVWASGIVLLVLVVLFLLRHLGGGGFEHMRGLHSH